MSWTSGPAPDPVALFLLYLDAQRGYSPATVASYGTDLEGVHRFLARVYRLVTEHAEGQDRGTDGPVLGFDPVNQPGMPGHVVGVELVVLGDGVPATGAGGRAREHHQPGEGGGGEDLFVFDTMPGKKNVDRTIQLPVDYTKKSFTIIEKSKSITITGNKVTAKGLRIVSDGSGSCVITFD